MCDSGRPEPPMGAVVRPSLRLSNEPSKFATVDRRFCKFAFRSGLPQSLFPISLIVSYSYIIHNLHNVQDYDVDHTRLGLQSHDPIGRFVVWIFQTKISIASEYSLIPLLCFHHNVFTMSLRTSYGRCDDISTVYGIYVDV
jgi:hypothetical protein